MILITNIPKFNYVELFESTTILAFLTAMVYFFPYTFNRGYYNYFGLPVYFQSLDLKNSLDTSYSILIYCFIMISLLAIIFVITRYSEMGVEALGEKYINEKNSSKIGIIILIVAVIILIIISLYKLTIIILSVVAAVVIVCFYLFYVDLRKKGSFLANLFIIILGFFFLVYIFYELGSEEAKIQKEFYFLDMDEATYVVHGMQDNNYVIAPYLIESNEIVKSFELIPISSDVEIMHIELEQEPKIKIQSLEFKK